MLKGKRGIDDRRSKNSAAAAKRIRRREGRAIRDIEDKMEELSVSHKNTKETRDQIRALKETKNAHANTYRRSRDKAFFDGRRAEYNSLKAVGQNMKEKQKREDSALLREATKTWKVMIRMLKSRKDSMDDVKKLHDSLNDRQLQLLGKARAAQYIRLIAENNAAISGGWVKDLTTEGIEPNPGPCTCARDPQHCQVHRIRAAGGRGLREIVCFNCGNPGHMANVCPNPRNPNPRRHPARRNYQDRGDNAQPQQRRPQRHAVGEPRARNGARNDADLRAEAVREENMRLHVEVDALREMLDEIREEQEAPPPYVPAGAGEVAMDDLIRAAEDHDPPNLIGNMPDGDGELPPPSAPEMPLVEEVKRYWFITAGHKETRMIDIMNPRYVVLSPLVQVFEVLSTLVFIWSSLTTFHRLWYLVGLATIAVRVAYQLFLTITPPFSVSELLLRFFYILGGEIVAARSSVSMPDFSWIGTLADFVIILLFVHFFGRNKVPYTKHEVVERTTTRRATGNFPPDQQYAAGADSRNPDERILVVTHTQTRYLWGVRIPTFVARALEDYEAGSDTFEVRVGDLMRINFIPAEFSTASWNQIRRNVNRLINVCPLVNGEPVDARRLAHVMFLRNCRNFSDNYSAMKSSFVLSLGDSARPQAQ